MKTIVRSSVLVGVVCLAISMPVHATKPQPVWIALTTLFEGAEPEGSFTLQAADFDDTGTFSDSAWSSGLAFHVDRTLSGTQGTLFVSLLIEESIAPDWCPRPPVPDGAHLVPKAGWWRITSGDGIYAGLQGRGAWGAWIVKRGGAHLSAVECMSGVAHRIK